MVSRVCGCVCASGLFLTSYQHGSVRVSLRNLDLVPTSLSSPPELVSKLLDPWEQQEHASSRRIATLVNEIAGEVRNGHKQVVVLDAPGVRAMGVGTPQRAPRSTPGGRVVSGRSSLVPLEVIKAKAALHVSDWDLDELDESAQARHACADADADLILAELEESSLLSDRTTTAGTTVEAFSLFRNSIAILKQDLVQDAPWVAR